MIMVQMTSIIMVIIVAIVRTSAPLFSAPDLMSLESERIRSSFYVKSSVMINYGLIDKDPNF